MTPIGSFSAIRLGEATDRSRQPRRTGDRDHLVLAQRLQQGVRDPVDRLGRSPCDDPQPVALVVQLECPPADLLLLLGTVEDRWVEPTGSLDAVVLADVRPLEHHAVALAPSAVGGDELVVPRRADVLGVRDTDGRVVDGELLAAGSLPDRLDRLLLAELRLLLEAARIDRLGAALPALGLQRPAGTLRSLDPEELLGQLLHSRIAGGHVARAVVAGVVADVSTLELDVADRLTDREDGELDQAQQLRALLQGAVGRRVLPEDLEQLVAIAEQLPGADLLLRVAEQVLLADAAYEVGVLVAEARVLERLVAAHLLVAGRDVDVGELGGVVVVAAVDVRVDATDRVDRLLEALEVDVDHVVDREAGQPLDRVRGELRAADRVGGVELVDAVARDLDLEVARQRHHRRRLLLRIEAHEDDRVGTLTGTGAAVGRVVGALVGAEQEDRLRLAREGLGDAVPELEILRAVERVDDLVDLVKRGDRSRRRRREDDQERAEQQPLPDAGARAVVVGRHLGDPEVPLAPMLGDRLDELDQRVAVATERVDRHPLLGAVVAVALRAELDPRHAGLDERDHVRGAVAPDGDALLERRHFAHGVGEQLHVRVVAVDDDRLAVEDPRDPRALDRLDGREDLVGVLAGQVAQVDLEHAVVGHAVHRVAAGDPSEADRRTVEEVGGLARERQGLDAAEDVDRLEDGVVAEPRGRSVRGAAVNLDPHREHALRLDADVEVGRLAGDREVTDVALLDDVVRGALALLLVGLLVRHADEVDLDGVLAGEPAGGGHHRREAALHVVGAAPVEAVAVDARLELLRVAGDDVDVAVQDHRRAFLRSHGRREHGPSVVQLAGHLDVVRLEPPLGEGRGSVHALEGRRVVGDQALGEGALVHPGQDRDWTGTA